MAIYGTTITVPTITGTHSGYVAQIKTGDLPTAALNSANQVDNGGGNIQIYTDDTKTTRLPIDIVECVTGGTPSFLAYVRMDSASTGADLYFVGDDVQTSQPAVGAAYGRNAVWSDYYGVFHCQDTSWTDSSGNGDLSPQGSNPPAVVSTPEGNAYRFDSADATFLTRAISITPLDRNLTLYSKSITKVFAGTPFYTLGVAGTLGGRDFSTGGINGTVTRRLQSVTPFSPVLATGALSGGSLTDQVVINITTWDSSDNFVIRGAYDGDLLNASGTTSAFSGDLIKMGLGGRVDASPEYFTFDLVGARFIESVLSTDYIDTQIDNEITPTWFSNDGWNLESGANAVQITESFPALVESISITATTLVASSITEAFPSPTEASSVNISLTVTSAITEIFPSPTESINIVTGGIVTGQITENFPSLVEATSVNIKSTIVSNVTESFPALVEGINITIPGRVVINGKHILRVNAVTKTVRINAVSKIKRFK